MKKLLLLLLFFPFLLKAQSIKGIVISKKNNIALEDTNITGISRNFGTLTNTNGEFSLKLPNNFKDHDSLQFSHIGFMTTKIALSDLKKSDFKVLLQENVENLGGLVIPANHKLRLKSKLSSTKLAPLKYNISSFGSLLYDNKIYVIGGDASFQAYPWEKVKQQQSIFTISDYFREIRNNPSFFSYKEKLLIYDIQNNSWQDSDLKFRKRAYHNLNYYDGKIYVLGGKKISDNGVFEYLQNEIEVFDIKTQNIKIDQTNPHQAANAASFTYNDNIIVIGGSIKMNDKNKKTFTNKVHQYNITSGYWFELTSMPVAKETTGVLIDDKIYLIGGNNENPLSQIETFDLKTEKWQTEGELFTGLEKPAVTFHENTIYFFENNLMYVYNIKSKQLKEYLTDINLKESSMHYYNNKLYILGGTTQNDFSSTPSDNVYSIDIEEFDKTQLNHIKVLSSGLTVLKTN